MINGNDIIERLEAERSRGADRDSLLRTAVEEIEASGESYDWVGVYLLEDDEILTLHNFVGKPTEHDRIEVGVGVCGTAVAEGRDINVPDVNRVDNYLACSQETRSELVVLIRDGDDGTIHGQIDLDSDRLAAFDERDEREIRRVAGWLADLFD